ncbi:DUF2147 domain-containing protein [Aquimarina hainanensis]|uniref:DUF2147 domain-containing protein n=1 Tax=Aquimarina hainanensis TaxID=1578017 RepID=A0ABW5NFG0_9FLAO
MKHIILFIIPFLFMCPATVDEEAYIGKWEIKGGSVIEIYKEKQVFYGKIYKRAAQPLSNLNGLDNKNPVKELRGRPIVGMIILDKLTYNEGELSGGTIYNADSGKTYTVKVWINSDDLNVCYIRAYKGWVFKTFTAKRVPPSLH